VHAAFDGRARVVDATSMPAAIAAAADLAEPGDAVVLSPGCASFDWYRNYGERGADFKRLVRAHLTAGSVGAAVSEAADTEGRAG
jgi:UDP-N-acetylmuramoylalanine--D-glutamate ligase